MSSGKKKNNRENSGFYFLMKRGLVLILSLALLFSLISLPASGKGGLRSRYFNGSLSTSKDDYGIGGAPVTTHHP